MVILTLGRGRGSYDGRVNISLGGDAVDATDAVSAEQVEIAEAAAKSFPGLRVAGLDLMLRDDGTAAVIEVNSSPMMSMHHFPWEGQPRDVYSRVLDVMFPATASRPNAVP